MADLAETIQNLAAKPEEVEADGLKLKSRPLADVIAADQYAKAAAAASNGSGKSGLRFTKFIGPKQCPIDDDESV